MRRFPICNGKMPRVYRYHMSVFESLLHDIDDKVRMESPESELPQLTLRLEVGASCFIDRGYYHTTWQFSHDLHKRFGSASSSPTVIICDLRRH